MDIRATFDWLQKSGDSRNFSTGAGGYCMEGRIACLAALTVPFNGAISYYGGRIGPSQIFPGLVDRLKDLKAPMLFFWGGKDQHIPKEQSQAGIDALRAAKKSYVTVEFSDADHGFFCDARPSYNAAGGCASMASDARLLEHTRDRGDPASPRLDRAESTFPCATHRWLVTANSSSS